MKTLHLLRHAKSSWQDPSLADHDRPLSKRGIRAATNVAMHLGRSPVAVDLVLCSTALRARQTLDAMAPAFTPSNVNFDRSLYEAGQRRLLNRIRKVPDAVECLLLIAHNPAVQELALALSDTDAGDLARRLAAKFPTAGLASFRFDGAWRDLRPQGATLFEFLTPKRPASTRR